MEFYESILISQLRKQTRKLKLDHNPIDLHTTKSFAMKCWSVRFASLYVFLMISCGLTSQAQKLDDGGGGGQWKQLQDNIGIVGMHMQLLHDDRVVIYDRTDFGLSNLTLPGGRCRNDEKELQEKVDCTAHSVDYDVGGNSIRPLFIQTDVWCSSGSAVADGRLIQTGGFNDGDSVVRVFDPCDNCDWQELGDQLSARRWYATNHILPDGRQIIVGGRRQFNYEFYPKDATTNRAFNLPFLAQTTEPNDVENNLYPFVFLNVDGNLFIFANNRSILFDYTRNKMIREYPVIPGGDPRSYPSTGSAVLLPLKNLQSKSVEAEVLICGGAPRGSYQKSLNKAFLPAMNTCGRIKITDPNPEWLMETMPGARVMSDMILLPNGDVLIINGGSEGTAGWESGRSPALAPFLYQPDHPAGSRFLVQKATAIPRMYHSTSLLLRDGRVLVSGSNPHVGYSFEGVSFPTELRLEAFSPPYLESQFNHVRPRILSPQSQVHVKHGQSFKLSFVVSGTFNKDSTSVTMYAPPFVTHSFSMNQRMLVLVTGNIMNRTGNTSTYQTKVIAPMTATLAPPGYYLLFVVHQQIPSEGIWIQIG